MGVPFYSDWFSLKIRRNRQSYIFASCVLIGIIFSIPLLLSTYPIKENSKTAIEIIFYAPAFIVSYCLISQRLRDINLSGWFALLWGLVYFIDSPFVDVLNVGFLLVLWSVPGSIGANKYGIDPLNEQSMDIR